MSSPEELIQQFEIYVPSETAQVQAVQDRIVGLLEVLAYHARDVFGVRLALEEALVNAIKHGNRLDPTKTVRVACRVGAKRVWVQIEDQGAGFDQDRVPDPTVDENLERPGGRGILLMRAFMNAINYNTSGNCVTLEKLRTPPDGDILQN